MLHRFYRERTRPRSPDEPPRDGLLYNLVKPAAPELLSSGRGSLESCSAGVPLTCLERHRPTAAPEPPDGLLRLPLLTRWADTPLLGSLVLPSAKKKRDRGSRGCYITSHQRNSTFIYYSVLYGTNICVHRTKKPGDIHLSIFLAHIVFVKKQLLWSVIYFVQDHD